MADYRQMQQLRKSVVEWNKWRVEHPKERQDFNDADLRNASLRGVHLDDADLRYAHLSGADLRNANLRNASLNNAILDNANLSGSNLSGADLSGANLNKAKLNKIDLIDADLRNAYLIDADLIGAYLHNADFNGADLSGADLSETDLRNAILRSANLSIVNLSEADLRYADLRYANLSGADLSKTDLSHAILNDADLNGTDLSHARVGWTSFGDMDLRIVKGLDTVDHSGPSPLSINTLYYSDSDISENFLRGTGAQDTFIEYARSLTKRPIEYYTCFISYSSKDQAFAKRLYNDLQGNGVRCWYAPEDLKTGDFFWKRIDESIKVYDKLLVILSSYSVESDWVEREVMAALEKEGQQKRHVLFPLHLDHAVKTTSTPWAADMRRRRHMTDFTGWSADYAVYQRGLERLLRDLKAENIK